MQRQNGFTMIEMMVVVAIVAILLAIGVPSYRYITNSYRMSAEVNSLLGDLQFARSEAIREGQTVTACVSTNGVACTGGNAWQNGWIVFSDPNGNATVDAGEPVLRYQRQFFGTVTDTFVATNALTALTYNREGFGITAAGFPNVTIVLNERTNNLTYRRCLLIAGQGTVSTTTHILTPGNC